MTNRRNETTAGAAPPLAEMVASGAEPTDVGDYYQLPNGPTFRSGGKVKLFSGTVKQVGNGGFILEDGAYVLSHRDGSGSVHVRHSGSPMNWHFAWNEKGKTWDMWEYATAVPVLADPPKDKPPAPPAEPPRYYWQQWAPDSVLWQGLIVGWDGGSLHVAGELFAAGAPISMLVGDYEVTKAAGVRSKLILRRGGTVITEIHYYPGEAWSYLTHFFCPLTCVCMPLDGWYERRPYHGPGETSDGNAILNWFLLPRVRNFLVIGGVFLTCSPLFPLGIPMYLLGALSGYLTDHYPIPAAHPFWDGDLTREEYYPDLVPTDPSN